MILENVAKQQGDDRWAVEFEAGDEIVALLVEPGELEPLLGC